MYILINLKIKCTFALFNSKPLENANFLTVHFTVHLLKISAFIYKNALFVKISPNALCRKIVL